MLRGIAFAFVVGWLTWFWLDKAAPAYQFALYQPGGEDLIRDFQVGVNLLKQGAFGPAFVYLWRHHYVLLAVALGLAGGPAVSALLGGISRAMRRARSAAASPPAPPGGGNPTRGPGGPAG